MSTRSITHIHEAHTGEERIVCSFYRHCDGYPDGHGKDLKEWLEGKRLVNGIDGMWHKAMKFVHLEPDHRAFLPRFQFGRDAE